MLSGFFIKISRNIINTPYYNNPTLLRAWMGLILTLRFTPTVVDGIDVGVGEVLVTKDGLSELFGVPKSRAYYVLKKMENDGLVTWINVKNKYTIITLKEDNFATITSRRIERPDGRKTSISAEEANNISIEEELIPETYGLSKGILSAPDAYPDKAYDKDTESTSSGYIRNKNNSYSDGSTYGRNNALNKKAYSTKSNNCKYEDNCDTSNDDFIQWDRIAEEFLRENPSLASPTFRIDFPEEASPEADSPEKTSPEADSTENPSPEEALSEKASPKSTTPVSASAESPVSENPSPGKHTCNGAIPLIKKPTSATKVIQEPSGAPPRKLMNFGEYNNVLLTREEFNELTILFADARNRIDDFSSEIALSGRRYDNHYKELLSRLTNSG